MNKKSKGIFDSVFYYSNEGKPFLIASIFLSTVGMLCNAVPYISVYFIGKIFLTGGERGGVFFWIMVAGAAVLCNLIFSFLGSLGCHRVAFKILYRYRIKLMEHLGKLPLGFFPKTQAAPFKK